MNRDADNWAILQSLFHLAEEHPETDLDALLLHACPDAELRARAKGLILLARQSAADPDASAAASAQGDEQLNRRIGPYTIVRLLGSGGIGTVYLTERIAGGVVQRAAVKVLSQHAAGPSFAERFAREQHILASLDHPNITRMLDAGLSGAGEPYLVMEYVDGIHMDTFCDDRTLDVPTRLKLFLQVCEAVAYAHRNLIVHLDLKPSNILITADEGNAKLLDFGTSKLIQPDSLLTTTVMATPAYASPEQLRNDPVTTACDVYSLGAILFEVLSGRRPNQDSSVAIMIERSIKELPPEPITGAVTPEAATNRGVTQTRLLNLLRGDLATIVAKCLATRPKDRYASVDALITDIKRYLAGRPIMARPQTTTYRLTKFVRRNRKSVLVGVLAVFALLVMGGYSAWRQEQSFREGQRALQMQNFIRQLFRLANSDHTGKPAATVPEFLQLGVKVVPDFIKDPNDLRAAQLSLAESIYDNSDFAHAQPVFTQVIASAKSAGDLGTEAEAEIFSGAIANLVGQSQMGHSLESHALSLAHKDGVTPATRVWIEGYYAVDREKEGFRDGENIRLLEAAVDESRKQQLPARETAWALQQLSFVYSLRGRNLDKAEALSQAALDIYFKEPYAVCDQSQTEVLIGRLRLLRGNYPGSQDMYRKAHDGFTSCMGPQSPNALATQVFIANAMVDYGKTPQEAVAILEQTLPELRKIVPDGSTISPVMAALARAYLLTGDYAKAESNIRDAMNAQKGKVNPNSSRVGVYEIILANALRGQGRTAEALHHAQEANRIYSLIPAMTPAEKLDAARVHQMLTDLSGPASQSSPPRIPGNK